MSWEPTLREELRKLAGPAADSDAVQVIPIPRDVDVRNRISMAYALIRQIIDASMDELSPEDVGSSPRSNTHWFLVGVPAKGPIAATQAAISAQESVGQRQKNDFLPRMETLISSRKFAEAEKALQEKLEQGGVIHPSLIYLLSSVQVHLGKKAEARDNLALLLRLKPDHERGRALAKKLET